MMKTEETSTAQMTAEQAEKLATVMTDYKNLFVSQLIKGGIQFCDMEDALNDLALLAGRRLAEGSYKPELMSLPSWIGWQLVRSVVKDYAGTGCKGWRKQQRVEHSLTERDYDEDGTPADDSFAAYADPSADPAADREQSDVLSTMRAHMTPLQKIWLDVHGMESLADPIEATRDHTAALAAMVTQMLQKGVSASELRALKLNDQVKLRKWVKTLAVQVKVYLGSQEWICEPVAIQILGKSVTVPEARELVQLAAQVQVAAEVEVEAEVLEQPVVVEIVEKEAVAVEVLESPAVLTKPVFTTQLAFNFDNTESTSPAPLEQLQLFPAEPLHATCPAAKRTNRRAPRSCTKTGASAGTKTVAEQRAVIYKSGTISRRRFGRLPCAGPDRQRDLLLL